MKLWLVLALCAVAAATPSLREEEQVIPVENSLNLERNLLINMLVRQMISYVRHVINYGSSIFRIPPLDPLEVESYNLNVPAQLINLDLSLKNVLVSGIGGFVVHTSNLDLRTMTFDMFISIPRIEVSAEEYDLIGDIYSAIPLFGKGKAKFVIENMSFGGKLHLKQSEDGKSVLFDRIENARFEIPALKSDLSGVIGGGDIDAIVNAIIEEVVVDYLNRFQAAIASTVSSTVVVLANPLLDQLDTWRYIAPLIPRW